ncbi:cytochrome C biogenesis protein ResB [Actinoplanes sp. SE50]|uniref:cytochrome c biogenesis protein ResB n=1 Tax=unclassified Actinoplanes TaxID=2626549 RepID=UPI00023EC014|nr:MULTISPECIES: cytochrome c biogenesis protein ResB [unclassified Actinoplanes]AEV81305.1 Cytochrome c biogenesis protein ccsB [Actinoplanes sp. SE50/110]ATO79708.1 cytochrome C biogenesis protein ResB [Actinoplanes sp. SE50]SLL97111.1 cytochrome c biogenesis protein ResB [Actinoplanes sp. SE50/110]
MTVLEERPEAGEVPPPRRVNPVWALLRNSWRQLTSMRTALVLLFLLAVAAIPGSYFPQTSVNRERVSQYYTAHPQLAPWIDRFGGFDVFASAWFAAIYLLLFTSLIGCVLPRLRDHARALRTVPPEAPRRLERLPQHTPARPHAAAPAEAAAELSRTLRRKLYRTRVRELPDGGFAVSGEKGYLKETGNLLFHFALLSVLIGVGFGHWYGWHGNRLLVAGEDQGFCDSITQYDDSALGPRVTAADLPQFCLRMTRFNATYQSTGQPKSFLATVEVKEGSGAYRPATFTVNDPLRLHHANVHLIGQGYAPVLRYTDRYGVSQTKVVPFLPTDAMQTSEGVAQFPDVNIDPKTNQRDEQLQVGFEGVYLPTGGTDGSAVSKYPAENSPVLFLAAYRGNLGLDVGKPGSVYALDRGQITNGELKKVSGDRPHTLHPGETWTLDDGTRLEFLGTRQFATLAIRYDPTQSLLLVGAVLGLIGLMLSLFVHRRRVWFRVLPAIDQEAGGSVVEAGGLPRTDYPGFEAEFAALTRPAEEGTP